MSYRSRRLWVPFLATLAVTILVALFTTSSQAEEARNSPSENREPARARPWHLELEFVTEVPLLLGARLGTELPRRVRLGTSLGYVPGGFVSIVDAIAVAAGAYDDDMSELVRSALDDSLVYRLHLGWRPLADYGFYFEVGYRLLALGGGVNSSAIHRVAHGNDPPPEAGEGDYQLESTVHMLDIEIGYFWISQQGWMIRLALGGAFTIGTTTSVTPNFGSLDPVIQEYIDETAHNADTLLTRSIRGAFHAPTLSIAVGYRFF